MAPNSSSNKPGKQLYSQMVQPALPLLPGSKGKKAKASLDHPEVYKADPQPGAPTTTNDVESHTDTHSAVDVSTSDTSQSGSWGDKDASVATSQ